VDIDPQRLLEARQNALREGVTDRVEFRKEDIFKTDLSGATVVTMYLLNEVNYAMRPNLFRDLKPGTRVVSHAFDMGDWDYDKLVHNARARNKSIFLWIIPAHLGGTWQWTSKLPDGDAPAQMRVRQEFQVPSGVLTFPGSEADEHAVNQINLVGREVTFSTAAKLKGRDVRIDFSGTVEGDQITGVQQWWSGTEGGNAPWVAARTAKDVAGSWRLTTGAGHAFDGVLTLERKGGTLHADFRLDNEQRQPKVKAEYFWGGGLRLDVEVPSQDTTYSAIIRGLLEGDAGSGTIAREGVYNDVRWSATRSTKGESQ
jgi:hypothetical protein